MRQPHQQWIIDKYRRKKRKWKQWFSRLGINLLEGLLACGLGLRLFPSLELPQAVHNIIGFLVGFYVLFFFCICWLHTFVSWSSMYQAGKFKEARAGDDREHAREKYRELVGHMHFHIGPKSWLQRAYGIFVARGVDLLMLLVLLADQWYFFGAIFLLSWIFDFFWSQMAAKTSILEQVDAIPYEDLHFYEGRVTDSTPTSANTEAPQPEPIPAPPQEIPEPRQRSLREIMFREDG